MHWNRPLKMYVGFWAAGTALMIGAYVANPPDGSLRGGAAYRHSAPGEFWALLGVTAVEILVFGLILRPWSYHQSWGRAMLGFCLLSPWLLLWGPLGLHASATTHAHTGLLFFFWLGLAAAAEEGARARRRTSRASGASIHLRSRYS